MSDLKFVSWGDDKQYSLVSGGLIYSLMKKMDHIFKGGFGTGKNALLMAILTWLPLAILTLVDGTFVGQHVTVSFIKDFLVHTRLLIAIPFLILIEKVIDLQYDDYINSTRRLVSQPNERDFSAITEKANRLSNSWIPEIVFLLLIFSVYFLPSDTMSFSVSRWTEQTHGKGLNLSGIYYAFISIPVFQLLLARWIWRWFIWAYTVYKFSRLDLKIEASHADQMAGLEYMRLIPISFSLVCLALSAIFAATIGKEIIYDGAELKEFVFPVVFFAVAAPLVLHLPLFTCIPLMLKARSFSMNRFSSLLQYHNNLYRTKWMEGKLPEGENILGSLDNSSMADINGSYQQAVKEMHLIPVDKKSLLAIMFVLLIPFTPLLFTIYSFSELISKLVQIVAG